MNNIKQLDLNLLKSFDALMRAGNVTAAAKEMSVGQSAMSHSLLRLRTLFEDQLFVRTAAGMVPTARANELAIVISPLLAEIENKLLKPAKFDPARIHHRFTLAMSDYLEVVLLPLLLSEISRLAPNVQIKVVQLDLTTYNDLLDAGDIDFAFGMISTQSSWHNSEKLFDDTRQCVFSPVLTGLTAPVSLKGYLQTGHVVRSLAANTESFVDDELEKLGERRKVSLSVPRFSTLPAILQKVPLIATLPSRLVEFCLQFDGLAASHLPTPEPDFDISIIWHIKDQQAAANLWFRDTLKKVVEVHL